MGGVDDAQKNHVRQMMQSKMTQAQLQEIVAQGKDPLFAYYQNQALGLYQQQARARMQQRPGMPGNVMPQASHPGQMNPALMGALGRQAVMADGQTFTPNMESIRSEHQMGLLAQQAGQLVVPASAAPGRNATPGPMAGLPPQTAPGNPQGPNQTPRPPQTQGFGMQQVKMEPTGAQVQGQPGMRAAAGRAMPGQPGATPTPNAPLQQSQSPAMNTLNAPMRQPPIPMGQGNGQAMNQGNQPMAATLNPQFNHQNNTRPPSLQGGMNNPAMAGMVQNLNPDSRAGMAGLDNGPMREFYAQLHEKQRAANNGFQGGPKPGLMPGMPGQLPQGSMVGPNQVGMINPNQKGNGAMQSTPQPATLQAQQQQQQQQEAQAASEKQQIMAIAQTPQGRYAMNNMDIAPPMLARLRVNIQIPAEVRKWGQLRQFLQANPGAMPAQMLNHLNNWQMAQFKNMLAQQRKPQTAPAVGPQPPNGPGPQQQGSQMPAPLPPGCSYPPNLSHVTRQDVDTARQKDPRFQNLPEEAVMEFIRRFKRDAFARKAWEQFQKTQGRGANNNLVAGIQNAGVQIPQTAISQQGGVNPVPHPNAPQGVQHQPAQPKPVGVPAAEPLSGTLKHARQPPNPSPAPAPKSLKRSSPDDATDTPNQPTNLVAQRPVSQAEARPQQGGQKPTTEQLMKLSPEQLARIPSEQLAKLTLEQQAVVMRGRASQGISQETVTRLRELVAEGRRHALQEAQQEADVPTPVSEVNEARLKLVRAAEKIKQLKAQSNIAKWYHLTKDDSRAKMFFKTVRTGPF
jgi:hypothetical protein